MKLSDLRLMYVNELDITEFSDPDYREDKLKSRLESDANIGHLLHVLLVFCHSILYTRNQLVLQQLLAMHMNYGQRTISKKCQSI